MSVSTFVLIVLAGWIGLALAMTVAWRIERRTGNAGWIDVSWTFGVGLVSAILALTALHYAAPSPLRVMIVVALIGVWSLRLGLHLVRRTKGIDDDPRYAKLKADMGEHVDWGMFRLAQAQALVSVPLVTSVALAAWSPVVDFRPQDALAIIVALVAIAGEATADGQMRAFRARPENKGRFCDEGLWRWSRHPNYFFEWLGWLAYPLFAISFAGGYPAGWVALSGALCMYLLLTRVSGVPPLEEHMRGKYGDSFKRYAARTSAFFPLPPTPSERGAP